MTFLSSDITAQEPHNHNNVSDVSSEHEPADLFQLIYSSSTRFALDDKATRELAEVSARGNASKGITGVLVSHNGTILQVLEGPETAVRTLFAKIEEDPRHSGAMVLIERYVKNREFPNWSMGYRNASNEKNGPALFELTVNSLKNALPSTPSIELDVLSDTFAKVSQL